jgi:non-ribosomal peptide synthetase component F
MQYIDFAVGQREWLEQGELQRQLESWTGRLSGMVPLVVPPDRSPPSERTYSCGVMSTSLDAETTAALRACCESFAATPFMILLTAVCLATSERSGQGRFLVGTDFANRNHGQTQSLVGFFVNQVVLPVECTQPRSVRELLMQVKNTVVDAADHQDLPFERLVEALRVDRRGTGRAPLFQVKVLYHEDTAPAVTLPGLRIDEYPMEPAEVELDLIFIFHADSERTHLTVKYDRELFEAQTSECIGQEIVAVLKAMLAHPDIGLDALRTEAARTRRVFESRRTEERSRKLAQWRAGLRARSATSPG